MRSVRPEQIVVAMEMEAAVDLCGTNREINIGDCLLSDSRAHHSMVAMATKHYACSLSFGRRARRTMDFVSALTARRQRCQWRAEFHESREQLTEGVRCSQQHLFF